MYFSRAQRLISSSPSTAIIRILRFLKGGLQVDLLHYDRIQCLCFFAFFTDDFTRNDRNDSSRRRHREGFCMERSLRRLLCRAQREHWTFMSKMMKNGLCDARFCAFQGNSTKTVMSKGQAPRRDVPPLEISSRILPFLCSQGHGRRRQ